MKAVGLITEYNPFHNGHLYHIQKSLKTTNADICIAIMSGNFVQRGEPAVINKYARCRAAINAGINLLVELPSFYALSSAEFFADGAIQICNALSVSSFVFGSECGSIAPLEKAAKILINEPDDYKVVLKNMLALGKTFPQARQEALLSCLKYSCESYESLLSSPNNILGIEYLKSLKKHNYSIMPYTIKRTDNGYHSETLSENSFFSSASAIRNELKNQYEQTNNLYKSSDNISFSDFNDFLSHVPNSMADEFNQNYNYCTPMLTDDFSVFLHYKLNEIFAINHSKQECIDNLCEYADITPELASRIFTCYNASDTFTQLVLKIKSRQYTYSRVCRCLMHIILNIRKTMIEEYRHLPYVRILGFDRKGQEYLSFIKKSCPVPLITKTSGYKQLLRDDIFCSCIYNHAVMNKFKTILPDEFHQPVYIKR